MGARESVLKRLEHADRLAVLDAVLCVLDGRRDHVAADADQFARDEPPAVCLESRPRRLVDAHLVLGAGAVDEGEVPGSADGDRCR